MIDNYIFQDKKVAFYTLGCKLNFAETSYIAKTLTDNGFRKVKTSEKADVCVINTCSVTDIADKKSRQVIKKMKKNHPQSFVIVTGCYAQLKPEEIAALKEVDLVLGTNEKFDIIEHLHQIEDEKKIFHTETKQIKKFQPSYSLEDRTRFFLKIQDGCDYYCTYCTIPLARGKSRNASIKKTLLLAKEIAEKGAKEVVLTGVNIGEFGKGTDENFLSLIRELDSIEGIERFRISSIEPNLLTEEIIKFVAQSKKFMPHFHIPLQSGSNAVLKLMKRKYTRELFEERVSLIKQYLPHAFIGVDVIVGTRGETEEYFEETKTFLQKLDISQLHVFTYSERANTKALNITHSVSNEDKKNRRESLHKLSEEKLHTFYLSQIGSTQKVLWERKSKNNTMRGFTENYIKLQSTYNKKLVNTIEEVTVNSNHINHEI